MNFDFMPELHWKFGYPLVMAVILIACLILYRVFTRNQWLGPTTSDRPTPHNGGEVPVSFLTKPWFWIMAFVVSWLVLIIVRIALGMGGCPRWRRSTLSGAGSRQVSVRTSPP